MSPVRALTLACLLVAPLAASAQWMYLDKDGRKVFSDKAPPPETPAKNILKQPGVRSSAAAPSEAPAEAKPAAAATAAAAPKLTGKDKELEDKRVRAEAAEAEKKKEEAAQQAEKLKAENCALAKSNKATLDSGVRLIRANEKGEREVLDDKQRAAEAKRIDAVIATDCQAAAQ